jgi:hypothetical protein
MSGQNQGMWPEVDMSQVPTTIGLAAMIGAIKGYPSTRSRTTTRPVTDHASTR